MNADVLEALRVREEPYYLPIADEVRWFEAAYAARLPVMLKGPTGCGKTRFIQYMAWRLRRPLVTVACNEELSASDLTCAARAVRAPEVAAGRESRGETTSPITRNRSLRKLSQNQQSERAGSFER